MGVCRLTIVAIPDQADKWAPSSVGLARKVFEPKRCLVRSRGRPGLVAQDDDTRVMDDDPRSPGARGVRY